MALFNVAGHLKRLAKKLADDAGRATLDALDREIDRFATYYLGARGGVELGTNATTELDFDLNSTATVALSRADMVPEAMRKGVADDQPITVAVKDLARLAYDMTVRGDVRLAQQLATIRASGVRYVVSLKEETVSDSDQLNVRTPFLEYSNRIQTQATTSSNK